MTDPLQKARLYGLLARRAAAQAARLAPVLALAAADRDRAQSLAKRLADLAVEAAPAPGSTLSASLRDGAGFVANLLDEAERQRGTASQHDARAADLRRVIAAHRHQEDHATERARIALALAEAEAEARRAAALPPRGAALGGVSGTGFGGSGIEIASRSAQGPLPARKDAG